MRGDSFLMRQALQDKIDRLLTTHVYFYNQLGGERGGWEKVLPLMG